MFGFVDCSEIYIITRTDSNLGSFYLYTIYSKLKHH